MKCRPQRACLSVTGDLQEQRCPYDQTRPKDARGFMGRLDRIATCRHDCLCHVEHTAYPNARLELRLQRDKNLLAKAMVGALWPKLLWKGIVGFKRHRGPQWSLVIITTCLPSSLRWTSCLQTDFAAAYGHLAKHSCNGACAKKFRYTYNG